MFGIDTTGKGTLNYPNVITALHKTFASSSSADSNQYYGIRVTHVGVYGSVSTPAATGTPSDQDIVFLEDAFTGRQVEGVSTPVKRARAGLVMSALKALRWYSQGNNNAIVEQDIAYVRVAASHGCPAGPANSYDIVVRGFARVSRNLGTCS